MKNLFIDSSVLIAACRSRIGASAAILALCKREKVTGYISQTVIRETRKNLTGLDQTVKNRLNTYLLQHKLGLTPEPPTMLVTTLAAHMREKDAPILAAAMQSPATYLVTLDYRDFLRPEVRRLAPGIAILSTRDFIRSYT